MDKILRDIVARSHESFARGKMQAMHEAVKNLPLAMQGDGSVGASGGGVSNCIEFVVETINYDTAEVNVTVSADTTYTITWGDEETSTGDLITGSNTLSHTYVTHGAGIQYSIRLCFENPSVVTELNFIGND